MNKECGICLNSNRLAIDREIVSGRSLSSIARDFAVDYESLYRHAHNHVVMPDLNSVELPPDNITEVGDNGKTSMLVGKTDIIAEIEKMLTSSKSMFEQSLKDKNNTLSLQCMKEIRSSLGDLSKIMYSREQTKLAQIELEKLKIQQPKNSNDNDYVKAGFTALPTADLKELQRINRKIYDLAEKWRIKNGLGEDVIPDNWQVFR